MTPATRIQKIGTHPNLRNPRALPVQKSIRRKRMSIQMNMTIQQRRDGTKPGNPFSLNHRPSRKMTTSMSQRKVPDSLKSSRNQGCK
jgi:hypothetical protein